MIENGNSGMPGKEEYQVSGRRPPKNVRQAGYFTGDLRIYVEDYVHTFTRWLAEQDYSVRCAAVLVGEFAKSEHTRDVYAYGTVVLEGACTSGKLEMTSEIWTQVYETIKNYFPDGEIVGWFYGGTSFLEEEKEMLNQVHLDHFAGTDRILMLYDFLEGEEEFYRYEGGKLTRQSGYYIYYEKNSEMQDYMVDKKQGKNIKEEIEDRAVREVRAKFSAQTKEKKEDVKKREESQKKDAFEEKKESEGVEKEPDKTDRDGSKILYAAGIIMAAIAVVAGASMIYSQERLKGFEQTLNQIIGAVQKEDSKNEEKGESEERADNTNIFDNQHVQETFQNNKGKGGTNASEPTQGSTNASDGEDEIDGENSDQTDGKEEKDPSEGKKSDEGSGGQGEDNKDDTKDSVQEREKDSEEKSKGKEGGAEGEADAKTDATGGVIDASNYRVYIVQPGDTLVAICMKLYGSVANLEFIKGLNQINNENLIFAYQELLVP